MADELAVGIDLGTTNSVIAFVNDRGQAEVVPIGDGRNILPSVVQIRPDGSTIVGAEAKDSIAFEKENTAHFFKRDMGTDARYSYRQKFYTPVDLSAEVLKSLKSVAEAYLRRPVRRAVVTVPAYFQDAARLATKEAATRAGLEVAQIINEPTAAAIAYGFKASGQPETVLVYDLGGGTFDVTLVRVQGGDIQVLGTDGNHTLGGKDWDDRLVQHFAECFRSQHGLDPLDDPDAFQEILVRAEDTKKALSQREKAAIAINCNGKTGRYEVTRSAFEAMTADLLSQTEMLIQKVLRETGHTFDRITSVLMVGGSTRMPAVGQLVRRLSGKTPNTSVNPDECVAQGAALQAVEHRATGGAPGGLAMLGKSRIRDVMGHSMGMLAVNAAGDAYTNSVLIPRNRPIPGGEVRPFQIQLPQGRTGTIDVYVTQGEGEDLHNVSFVGKFTIAGVPGSGRKPTVVDIRYEYDRSGVVNVTALEKKSSAALEVKKQPLPDDMSWIFEPPKKQQEIAHKLVYLAVDSSGSMSGTPMEQAKAAVRSFIDRSDLAHTSIGLISFANRVHIDVEACQDAARLAREASTGSFGTGVGGGNSAHPFDDALRVLGSASGPRFVVVLADGVWDCQSAAIEASKRCKAAGIEVVAIGFGGADHDFLRRIATSDEAALMTTGAGLGEAFSTIAQVLVESDGQGGGLRFWKR